MTDAKPVSDLQGPRPGNQPRVSRARPGAGACPPTPARATCGSPREEKLPLDAAGVALEDPLVEVPEDAVLLVRKAKVAIRERASARTELLARGALDDLQGHFLAHRAPLRFVWVVVLDGEDLRLFLHSRPLAAAEAA